jgi:hypothetical protein
MRCFITTLGNDLHAAAVASELRARGHSVFVHYGEDFPAVQPVSIRFGSNRESAETGAGARGRVDLAAFDTVWNRRRIAYALPDRLHPDDRDFARKELRAFTEGLWDLVSPAAFWVNPLSAAAKAKRKIAQLVAARACGMPVPETLMSNDPDEIRAFVRAHGGAVYKSFMPAFWEQPQAFRSLFATVVGEHDLGDDDALSLCPGIYQVPVRAAYELRVTVFGRNAFALQHARPDSARGIDARAGHLDGMRTASYALPGALRERLMAFMATMDLRFACFDILAMPGGDYCFLEANEAGQFLWVEQLQPEIPMLDAFCSYLERADDDYVYAPGARPVRLGDRLHSADYEAARDRRAAEDLAADTPLFVGA